VLTGGSPRHGEHIAETHRRLWKEGILTKSMVTKFMRCPESLYQLMELEQEAKPTFWMVQGNVTGDTLEEWGLRRLAGTPFPLEESRQFLSDRWDHHMAGIELPQGITKDERLSTYKQLLIDHERAVKVFNRELVGVEVPYGYDGDVELGGVKIAGHPDQVWKDVVVDLKTVKSSSPYLLQQLVCIELAMYGQLTGLKRGDYVCLVHNLKTRRTPWVRRITYKLTDAVMESAGNTLAAVRRSIDAGAFPPVLPKGIGTYPCIEPWCDYYGRCNYTKGLK
jgi:CRISPR/Cas system-associated exonuclease Cas4 (RecB family)